MNWKVIVRSAFDARRSPDDDVIDELAEHAAAAFEAARAEGCDAGEAEGRVRAQLASWASDEALLRKRPRRPPAVLPPASTERSRFAGVGAEFQYAGQLLVRQWGHTLVVVLTMALGIAVCTVLFSVAYGVLVRPLPWPHADRLVRLYETRQGSTRPPRFLTNATFLAWTRQPSTIEALAGWSTGRATLSGVGDADRVTAAWVTPGALPMFGARPVLGRLFETDEGRVDEGQVILSHALWQERFGSSPSVLGRVIRLNGVQCRVVGVMAPFFSFPSPDTRAWMPFEVPPVSRPGSPGSTISMFQAVARLKPGVTAPQAAQEATARARSGPDPGVVVMAVFGRRGPAEVSAIPLVEATVGDVRPALILFLVAVGLLLATATANVASLQLARATGRRRELAIRAALGAGSGRLARQLLVENGLLGCIGGLLGLVLAASMIRLLPVVLPADFPRLADIALDWRAALFALGVSLLTGVAFGAAPALGARRLPLSGTLAEDGAAPVGGSLRTSTARTRTGIMLGEVAVAAVLLVGAALLGRSFLALLSADRGYNPGNVLTAVVSLPDDSYTAVQRMQLLDAMTSRLRSVPGVEAAAFSTGVPLVPRESMATFPMRGLRGEGTVQVQTTIRHVSPGYFEALRIRVAEGRSFTRADGLDAPPVVVVNRAFARQYLGSAAVGARIPSTYKEGATEAEVVGVIEDVRNRAVDEPVPPEIYRCALQLSNGFDDDVPSLVVRTAGDPTRLVPTLRDVVRQQGSAAAVDSVMTMEGRLRTSLARPRLYALLLAVFAGCALVIAGVGLFGVLSYAVQLRSREMGVRAALGASPAGIVGLVLRQGLAVTVVGLAIGLAVSAALAQYLSRLLYGVGPYDGASYLAVPVLILAVAVLACVVPARRAARVDPVRVLR